MKKLFKILLIGCVLISLAACSSKKSDDTKEVDLKVLLGQLMENENLPALTEVEEDMVADLYFFDPQNAKQIAIAMPLMNVQASEIMLVEANEGKLDEIKQGIAKRLETLEGIWSRYLPEQYELVQNAQIIEEGNFYGVIIAEDAETLAKTVREALK